MNAVQRLARDYRSAFLGYLPRRDEAPLHRAYELGRTALGDGVSLLELARVHHEVFFEVLRDTPNEDLARVNTAASEFLLEALSAYDMIQRGLVE
jgi:hypothetical protein